MKIKSFIKNKNFNSFLFMIPILIFIFVFSVYPIIFSFFSSFQSVNSFNGSTSINLNNYKRLFLDINFKSAIKNSTILFFVSSPIALFLGFVIAILLSRISNKICKKFLISAFYSQFFISGFAIGISFAFLFGQKNVLAKILNLNYSFTGGKNPIHLVWLYVIFQLWRAIPFNIVLFFFSISNIDKKYEQNIRIDKLTLKDKIFYLYFKQIKNQFLIIAYTNFIFATMLYPTVIIGKEINLELNDGNTIASYIIDLKDDNQKQYAAAFISLLFLILSFCSFLFFKVEFYKFIYFSFKKILNKGIIKWSKK